MLIGTFINTIFKSYHQYRDLPTYIGDVFKKCKVTWYSAGIDHVTSRYIPITLYYVITRELVTPVIITDHYTV